MPMIIPGRTYEVANWAALLALTGVPDGRTYRVLAPLCAGGAPGTAWTRDGGLWRPGVGQVLAWTSTPVDGLTVASEQAMWQLLLPGGVLRGVRTLRLRGKVFYSSADTSGRAVRFRLGTTGTAADAQLMQLSVAAGARQAVPAIHYEVVSDTEMRVTQLATGVIVSPDGTNSSTSAGSAVDAVVPSLSSSALYLTLFVSLGAGPVSVPTLMSASIYVE